LVCLLIEQSLRSVQIDAQSGHAAITSDVIAGRFANPHPVAELRWRRLPAFMSLSDEVLNAIR
jgi:hypothetical protein